MQMINFANEIDKCVGRKTSVNKKVDTLVHIFSTAAARYV